MNAIDIVILVLVAAAVVRGALSGTAPQVGFWAGLVVGVLVGAAVAPHLAGSVTDPASRALIGLAAVAVPSMLLAGLGQWGGGLVTDFVRTTPLAPADAVLGGVVAAVATLLVTWIVTGSLAATPVAGLGPAIQQSSIARWLDDALPPVPSVTARLSRITDPLGFTQVFAGIAPAPASPVNPPLPSTVSAAASAALPATVRIEGKGCGGILEGSGFVAADHLVVTNAHVVAGIRAPVVIDTKGNHSAVPVLFDPSLDLAVLRTDVSAAPLPLAAGDPSRGAGGAVLGYPGGGPLTVAPGAVLDRYEARGRDVYGAGLTTREVVELQAEVRPGNSGGPFVLPDGTVGGIVFARSLSNGNVGYALSPNAVRSSIADARSRTAAVSTGACAAD